MTRRASRENINSSLTDWFFYIPNNRGLTSWPYFRVKLSCVCLKFAYKKKSKNKIVKKYTQYLLLVGFKKIKYKKKGWHRII